VKRALGFVHDFAAGCWAATALAVLWLGRLDFPEDARPLVQAVLVRFFWVGVGCVVAVFATGASRSGEPSPGMRSLLLQHAALLAIFGAATVWEWAVVFR
jgi:putative copper export protein